MAKSRDAFRTISEVSDALDTPTHVLRFWESKFTQIKPVKRAGGRRYYRPEDIDLLAGIKTLLHDQGLTIKGAQKLMREQGVKHVIELGEVAEAANGSDVEQAELGDDPTPDAIENEPAAPLVEVVEAVPEPENEPQVAVDVDVPKMPPAPIAVTVATPIKTPARVAALAATAEANQVFVHSNKSKISPLLKRLQALRDAMDAA